MNTNDTHIKDNLLVKYLLDEANATERQQVEDWIHQEPANQKYYQDFKLIVEKSEFNSSPNDLPYDALDRLNQRMKNGGLLAKPSSLFTWTRLVAALVIISLASWLGYRVLNQNEPAVNVYTTSKILKQELPDGSIVTLNKNSELSADFSGETRAVVLKGEAFFNVTPNPAKPFIIKVNDIIVKVVGTSFNVKSRNDHTVIIVESGIVQVNRSTQNIELRKGEKVSIDQKGLDLTKEQNNSQLYNYYYSDELVCNQTRLDELVPILNEKFNVKIIITKPALQELPINTTFKNTTLDRILKVIAGTHAIEVVYADNQILLK